MRQFKNIKFDDVMCDKIKTNKKSPLYKLFFQLDEDGSNFNLIDITYNYYSVDEIPNICSSYIEY
jgi:hypothetical protein